MATAPVVPAENRMKFFVYIIESPSRVDVYHGRSEGQLLKQMINLNGIPCVVRTAIGLEPFLAALRVGLPEAMQAISGLTPIIHISAHGSPDGIQLSSGEVLSWKDLRELLLPINKALGDALFVCMSTCHGYSGSRMAMVLEENDHPFFVLIGNGGSPTWQETAVGFSSFYHLIGNGHYILNAVQAMRYASGNNEFYVTTADAAKQDYAKFIAAVNPEEAAQELIEEEQNERPGEVKEWLQTPNQPPPA